jgi:uncharacterized protein DUF3842
MRVCVIDGRGGGLGKRLIRKLRHHTHARHEIIALGTNEVATEAMRQEGVSQSGTGEQRIKQAVSTVDVILASLNLVIPGSMLGEVTPGIAEAILNAPGRKLLLPINRAKVEVVGSEALTLESLIARTISRVHVIGKESLLA